MSLRHQVTFVHKGQAWELWAYLNLQSLLGKSQKKCCELISKLYFLEIGEEIGTANQGQHTGSQLEMQAGHMVGTRSQDKTFFLEDRLALWGKFSYLLVFRED